MSATPEQIAELLALSEKASRGEWKAVEFYTSTQLQADDYIVTGRIGVIDGSNNRNDAAFIVACVNYARAALKAAP